MKWLLWILAYLVGVAIAAAGAQWFSPKGSEDAKSLFAIAWPASLLGLVVLMILGAAILAGHRLAAPLLRRWPE